MSKASQISIALLTAMSLGMAPGPVSATGDPATGRRLAAERGCPACHDPAGVKEVKGVPFITGQKKAYMVRQLKSFRRLRPATPGPLKFIERAHPTMDGQTEALTDAEIAHLAEYYAGLPCVPRRGPSAIATAAPPLLKRCAFCHGTGGSTPYVTFPDIGGQKKDYLIDQLRAFRDAAQHGDTKAVVAKDTRFHRTMAPSVYDLGDRQIEALADYYSRQSCQ